MNSAIDDYIASHPPAVQAILKKIRATIKKATPKAEEVISYRMPAFKLNGILVYIGAFKNHIGLYPPVNDPKLKKEAARYAGPKGNLQFPFDEPIPYALIAKIVKANAKANLAKTSTKKRKKE
jgi:uncharacterized protein YdhG (YjbR/CyaY superfamily)